MHDLSEMWRALGVVIALGVVLWISGCGKAAPKSGVVAIDENDQQYVPPANVAFDGIELGEPIDWKNMSEADKALLNAFWDSDVEAAKKALADGADPKINCGSGMTTLMHAAAIGSAALVQQLRDAGVEETEQAKPYLEVLNFAERADDPRYREALAEVEKLTSAKPTAATERPGLFTVELDAKAAAAFLDKQHAALLKKGCYVWLAQQRFGLGNKPDVIGILPTTNKFAVMAFNGINGANYDIDTAMVILWMQKLNTEHPYDLTGCSYDFMSGKFKEPIAEPVALAKRMYEFCPDIVDQGTGDVEALAAELKKSGKLYFWWD
jgi:hypothetical protein